MPPMPIAITGLGAVTALGAGVAALWKGLLAGQRPFGQIRAFSAGACKVDLAAEVTCSLPLVCASRTVNLGVAAAREALLEVGSRPTRDRIGLVVASTGYGDALLEAAAVGDGPDVAWCRECLKGSLADQLGEQLGLGPARQVINTACSSGAIAIGLACDGLLAGDYDMALAIGCDELAAVTYSGFHALRALDPNACRPFDRQRRGMSIGEGAGCVVLERLEDARQRNRRIRALLMATGTACDAHHLTAPDPLGKGAALAMSNAIERAGIVAAQVGFVNAHGTGTPLNDSAEIAGIERALGGTARRCPVHSVKASTGHCMGAAGTIEAIVAVMSLESQIVPATAGLVDCEFAERVDCVMAEPRSIQADYAISNSFGFGGNDATLVLGRSELLAS